MKAVVPAAGEGTRLRPLTADTPKGLVEVAGRPLLTHVFDALLAVDVDEIVVVIGYEGEQIVAHYGDTFRGVPLQYVEQDEQLGLGHAVLQARPAIDETFLVLNGDNVFGDGIDPVLEAVREPETDGALLVERTSLEAARETGVVETANGEVTRLVEKPDEPPSRLATTGCYVLPPATFEACEAVGTSDRGEYELPDAIDRLLADGYRFAPVEFSGWRQNVNDRADIRTVETRLEQVEG